MFADIFKLTAAAIRLPGFAAFSSKENKAMAKVAGFFGRENFSQLLFAFGGVFGVGQA